LDYALAKDHCLDGFTGHDIKLENCELFFLKKQQTILKLEKHFSIKSNENFFFKKEKQQIEFSNVLTADS
jgi:hypothetical protein